MKSKIFFLIMAYFFYANKSSAQFYIQPQYGYIFNKSSILVSVPQSVSVWDQNHYFGLLVGKRVGKIDHAFGYFHHYIGISHRIDGSPIYGYGWGTTYMVLLNFSYKFDYNILHWKRLDVKVGSNVHLAVSRATYPSLRSIGGGTIEQGNIIATGIYTTQAFERSQLLLEPHLDIDFRLLKRVAFNLHVGHVFGNKNIYTMTTKYTLNSVLQSEGSNEVDGTGNIFSTGFKFYFKEKKPKE